ncbi:hypothetical protein [Chitinophaga pinensis]|uniref:DUF4251 domain-containing protein n=1 Tax=Chitinophaga pinensis (strain ATCC 43595 / DSM 2588 / LMG 13176 / NBRC 15968 / NCIMB 11800 / UQM 2034) TaxID=485918 RepID=A0A979FZ34_CHIPD|nr:hypothetical protein [Chitinophaga pinensis]ACU57778.1 hypothetical protein Cpin_0279 [Chitinophaga pinensis DSM 2588]
MKRFILKACCTLMLLASCFIFTSSNAQQLKVLGKPFSEAYGFAGTIAQTMHLKAPDSANTNTNRSRMQVSLKSPDSDARRIIIEFNKDEETKADIIYEVSITGSIPDIIELYANLYDKKVKTKKPEDVYMAVNKDGEIISVRTDYESTYAGFEGTLGRIFIRKK